jgi:steroid 5-alpha reductase family enzyme
MKNEALATGGPYGITRNPLYLGNFLIGFGVAAMGGNLWLLVLFLVLFVPVYQSLTRKEEGRLLDRYGDDFHEYCREVPRFIPKFKTWRPSSRRYDLRRMWETHREWRAWLGLYAVTLYLLLRAR